MRVSISAVLLNLAGLSVHSLGNLVVRSHSMEPFPLCSEITLQVLFWRNCWTELSEVPVEQLVGRCLELKFVALSFLREIATTPDLARQNKTLAKEYL